MTTTQDLHNYETGEYVRPATEDEVERAAEAAAKDGGAGVIETADVHRAYVA